MCKNYETYKTTSSMKMMHYAPVETFYPSPCVLCWPVRIYTCLFGNTPFSTSAFSNLLCVWMCEFVCQRKRIDVSWIVYGCKVNVLISVNRVSGFWQLFLQIFIMDIPRTRKIRLYLYVCMYVCTYLYRKKRCVKIIVSTLHFRWNLIIRLLKICWKDALYVDRNIHI